LTDKRQQSAWEKHELEQLVYFRSLSLRQKLQAVEGMADVVRHFRKIRSEGGFREPDQTNRLT